MMEVVLALLIAGAALYHRRAVRRAGDAADSRAKRHLDTVADDEAVVLIAWNPDGIVTAHYGGHLRSQGIPEDAMIGAVVEDVWTEWGDPKASAALAAIRSGRSPREHYTTTRGGTSWRVNIRANADPGAGYALALNVTEYVAAQTAAEADRDRAQAAVRRIGEAAIERLSAVTDDSAPAHA